MLVLLLEDEAMIALLLQDELEDAGYRVAGPFASCADTLQWLTSGTPDLAILDMVVKDGSCRDVARELTHRGVPFIVYSGHSQDRHKLDEFSTCVWMEKPTSSRALIDKIQELRAGPLRRHG